MAKAPRITFLQPDPQCTPNRLEKWFSDLGLRTSVVPLDERDVPQLSAAGDGLVILGGRMNALDTRHHRWLDPLGDLIADAHSIGVPILGVCLGHQILGHVLGGEVTVDADPGAELGCTQLTWHPTATDDPVFGELARRGPTLVEMSHHDVVSVLPPGAVALASSPVCENAVMRLDLSWGVQYHPEKLTTSVLVGDVTDPVHAERVVGHLAARDAEISSAARTMARCFADVVRNY